MTLDRAAQWAEILANVGVILSLVFLVVEVQENTEALRVQAAVERSAALNTPMLTNPELPGILAKIKGVDGGEPNVEAFMTRYDLTYGEATVWIRYLAELWAGLNAEYDQLGPSDELTHRIEQLVVFPDESLWLDSGTPEWVMSDEFIEYVAAIREAL